MSQHPSLKIDTVGTRHRNVLKRTERIKKMQGDSPWDETKSVYGLPKFKSMKIKVKKAKTAKAGEAKPAAGAVAPAAAGKKAEPSKKAAPAKKAEGSSKK